MTHAGKDPRGLGPTLDREEKRAEKIRAYWLVRNFDVRVWIADEGVDQTSGTRRLVTRSDMVNGYPVRRIIA